MQNNMIINMLMGKLKNNNPNGYNELQQLINSGKNPQQIINEMLNSGRFTQSQVQQAQQLMGQYTQNTNNPRRF